MTEALQRFGLRVWRGLVLRFRTRVGGEPGRLIVEESEGDYGGTPRIVQAFAPLFQAGGQHAVLGAWVVGDRACGLGVREDSSRITRDLSRFVPHIIVDG